jgi:hypothetical protein
MLSQQAAIVATLGGRDPFLRMDAFKGSRDIKLSHLLQLYHLSVHMG